MAEAVSLKQESSLPLLFFDVDDFFDFEPFLLPFDELFFFIVVLEDDEPPFPLPAVFELESVFGFDDLSLFVPALVEL